MLGGYQNGNQFLFYFHLNEKKLFKKKNNEIVLCMEKNSRAVFNYKGLRFGG
jgi:hypothetical protein